MVNCSDSDELVFYDEPTNTWSETVRKLVVGR